MPRTALYEVDVVLDQAIDIFLEHSYHGAIMDEIIARTDFNRRGFYLEFGSKQIFLYKVLSHYETTVLGPIVSELDSHQGIVSIQQFFDRYIELIYQKGCLLINMVTELGVDNPTVKDMGRHYLDKLQIGFIGCLEQGQKLRQIQPTANIEAAALQLTSFVQGFAVNAILAESIDEMKIATKALLGPLQIDWQSR